MKVRYFDYHQWYCNALQLGYLVYIKESFDTDIVCFNEHENVIGTYNKNACHGYLDINEK